MDTKESVSVDQEKPLPWDGICLDDGSGKNVHYIDKSGKRSRNMPPNYIPETFSNGLRRYYFRGRCIRCRKDFAPSYLTAERGDLIWNANHDIPLNTYIDLRQLVEIPNREAILLERSKVARFEVLTYAKERRNAERAKSMKQFAIQHGVVKGVHLSWGFGDPFDEYYGEVNSKNQPSGLGVKVYSDGSVYVGGWEDGLRHSSRTATWSRPDGMQYEGTWVNDFKHGKGIQRFPDGSEYRGEFAKGYEHGQGNKTYVTGDRFEGRFRFGKRDGPGVLYKSNGEVIKRTFRENDAVHEASLPIIVELLEPKDGEEVLYQPESLLSQGIRALARAMHTKRHILPSKLLNDRLPEYLKTAVAKEYLSTMHPLGSSGFLLAGPSQAFRNIPDVSLRYIKFRHFDAESFLYFTTSNIGLQKLELLNNRLDPPSIEMICKTIRAGCWLHLKTLNLSFNRIDITVIQSLLNSLREGAPRIEGLGLAGCQVTPQGGALLARYLSTDPRLLDLDLAFNMVQAAGAERLAEALLTNHTLTKLNLRQNNIGTIGCEALVEAMKVNLSVRVLCVADNKVGAHLAFELSARLRGTTAEVAESFRASQLRTPAIHQEKKEKRQSRGKSPLRKSLEKDQLGQQQEVMVDEEEDEEAESEA
eukprot:scaffold3057_cov163-Ochromonas_danica.AAC.8